ncbi:Hypothetical predicted protein [Octopus vulgaris]|uniref:Uncharacterized protein n=1 Tax=Octopus vulgaris TaxID=6645 RepID=A0AA36FLN3_OCTVU|nr:Hypothetical predicted protein [Octopus vulgaris]
MLVRNWSIETNYKYKEFRNSSSLKWNVFSFKQGIAADLTVKNFDSCPFNKLHTNINIYFCVYISALIYMCICVCIFPSIRLNSMI